jgi:VanZ family protein
MISQRSAACLLYTSTVFYVLLLVTLTHLPLDSVVAEGVQEQARLMWMDKVVHGVLYTFLTLLFLLCSQPVSHDEKTGDLVILPDRLLAMAIIVMLVGLLDEMTQPWFGRNLELLDLAADFAAIFPGSCLFLLSHIIRQSFGQARI